MSKLNIPFIAVLTGVWLILLALCALIGVLIVPVSSDIDSVFLRYLISGGKVGLSLFVILIWLLAWYKAMDFLLKIEFYLSDNPDLIVPTDD